MPNLRVTSPTPTLFPTPSHYLSENGGYTHWRHAALRHERVNACTGSEGSEGAPAWGQELGFQSSSGLGYREKLGKSWHFLIFKKFLRLYSGHDGPDSGCGPLNMKTCTPRCSVPCQVPHRSVQTWDYCEQSSEQEESSMAWSRLERLHEKWSSPRLWVWEEFEEEALEGGEGSTQTGTHSSIKRIKMSWVGEGQCYKARTFDDVLIDGCACGLEITGILWALWDPRTFTMDRALRNLVQPSPSCPHFIDGETEAQKGHAITKSTTQ